MDHKFKTFKLHFAILIIIHNNNSLNENFSNKLIIFSFDILILISTHYVLYITYLFDKYIIILIGFENVNESCDFKSTKSFNSRCVDFRVYSFL